MQHVQRIEIAGDGLGALDMKDGRETAGLDRTADIGSIAADGNAAFGTLFDVEEQPRHGERLIQRIRLRRRRIIAVGILFHARRRDIDGAETAGQTALAGTGQIDVPDLLAVQERGDRILLSTAAQPQEHVIVTVENRKGRVQHVDESPEKMPESW